MIHLYNITVVLCEIFPFQFQSNFTRSFSNLLNAEATAVRESQETFEAASGILDTLVVFGERVEFENTSLKIQEMNLHLQVEDIESDQFEMRQIFKPDLTNTSSLADIQANPMELPLQEADISLSNELLNQIGSTLSTETLRVFNVLMLSDVLFVTDPLEDDEGSMTGNLMISARIYDILYASKNASLTVDIEDLPDSQAVLIRFNLTEV